MSNYLEIKKCRICGNTNLISILQLGNQALTGVFPKIKDQVITSGPLNLVKCNEENLGCGLVQLQHSFDSEEMYGLNYGYRSSLNSSMVSHLQQKVEKILEKVSVDKSDLVIDIGSNDSTLLQRYPQNITLVGIDPSGAKFQKYYPANIQLISDFFSSEIINKNYGERKATIVTSIAMFYDLEAPLNFVEQINDVLADEGVWVFEQSYLPTMLEKNAYDTICHEHLEYYRLKQIKWMLDKVGLKIIDIEINSINGGSFSIMAAKKSSTYKEDEANIQKILNREIQMGLDSEIPYIEFKQRVMKHRDELCHLIKNIHNDGKKIFGYGASTKGNVLLQFCDLTSNEIPYIAEVNPDKFGSFTPGTNIPIISEEDAKDMRPDFYMVLPWHFKENILKREEKFLENGGKLVMPLPKIEIVQK